MHKREDTLASARSNPSEQFAGKPSVLSPREWDWFLHTRLFTVYSYSHPMSPWVTLAWSLLASLAQILMQADPRPEGDSYLSSGPRYAARISPQPRWMQHTRLYVTP
jgi:hypothetical protein